MFFAVALLCQVLAAWAIPIDNGVKGYPQVTCGPHSVIVDVDTERTFNGRIYVKNEAHRKECVRSFGGAEYLFAPPAAPYDAAHSAPADFKPPVHANDNGGYTGSKVGVELKFGECNMRRQRTLHPRGVEYTFTLVASFHPIFLTKIDRAYRVRCFYMEATKTVDVGIDVSMLTTHQLNQQFPMPQCHYHLKRGGYDGPYVRYAKVGDKVVHVWECEKVGGYIFGILVHSCYVDDGQGNKVQLIDEKGCATDRHLVPNLTYNDHLIAAHVETHVFKYADKPHLFFHCTVQLCFKNDGGCQGLTPPKCGYGHPTPAIAHHGPPPPPPAHPLPLVKAPEQYPNGHVPLPRPAEHKPVYALPHPAGYPLDGGHQIRPLPPRGPHGLPVAPYKDEPVDEDAAKAKRSIKSEMADKIEADLSAQPIVVLPFDIDEEDDSQLDSLTKLDELLASRRSYRVLADSGSQLPGVCMSSSGFGIMVALFIALLLFSAVLTVLVVRRQWTDMPKL